MTKKYWPNGVNEIISKVLNGKRTIQQAKDYLHRNYTGDSRKAFNHAAYETTGADITAELIVYGLLKDAIKLGHGKDLNFENVFR